ncbi:hypothetical protein [Haliangium sp.]|uniref:hypothetical protein n=1 Tax=Haliangium sp. TaxID=2663208 RepID=UPI003D0C9540
MLRHADRRRLVRAGRGPACALAALAVLLVGAEVRAQDRPGPEPGPTPAREHALVRDHVPVHDHVIDLAGEVRAVGGGEGAISLTITARPGHRVAAEAPLVVSVGVVAEVGDAGAGTASEPGLSLPRRRYRRRDAADPRAAAPRFDLAYRARAPGTYPVVVEAGFWVCARRTCRPVRFSRRVAVEVAAP